MVFEMKCPECGAAQNPRKHGMRCSGCEYRFVFDPRQAPGGMSDDRLLNLVKQVSAQGTRYFTLAQLYLCYLNDHYLKGCGRTGCVLTSAVLLVSAVAFAFIGWWAVGLPLLLMVTYVLTPLRFWVRGKALRAEVFDRDIVQRWETARAPLAKLIRKPQLHHQPQAAPFADIYDYGVACILVVQQEIVVDLMIRNGWHAEHKALVMAESGYPSYVHQRAKKLLAAQDDLPVLLLHDATEAGEDMRARIEKGKLLPVQPDQIRDLGFQQADVARMDQFRMWRRDYGKAIPLELMSYATLAFATAAAVRAGSGVGEMLTANQRSLDCDIFQDEADSDYG